MGHYFFLVNRTKRQHTGAYRLKYANWKPGGAFGGFEAAHVLPMLVVAETDECAHPLEGSWSGDEVALIGEYSDEAKAITADEEWEDVSADVRAMLETVSTLQTDDLQNKIRDLLLDFYNEQPFTSQEKELLERGWSLLWDSEQDYVVDDDVANSLIEGRIIGDVLDDYWCEHVTEDGACYRIYRGVHIRAVYVKT